jgi:uncharacterized protein (TIGR03546 family)
MLKIVAKLFAPLNGNQKRSQVAAGFSWGLLLGLIPTGNVFWIVLFVVSFFFRNNHLSKILFMLVIKLFFGVLNPLVDMVGWAILHIEALQPFFTTLYNMPLVPLTKFNNTLVAGGLCMGVILWLPFFFLVWLLIPLYHNVVVPKIRASKFFKPIEKSPLVPAKEEDSISVKEKDDVSVICTDLDKDEIKEPEALDEDKTKPPETLDEGEVKQPETLDNDEIIGQKP